MKNLILYLSAACISLFALAGCEKGAGDREYGYPYLLMPQAQRIEGYYAVPGGSEERTRNFRVEEGKVLVFLGVLRSGKVADKAFSVDIVVNDTPAGDFIYDNIVPNSIPMPGTVYTLPEKVDVPDGSYNKTFYLELDAVELQKPEYDDKCLVLCVELANPTQYRLARSGYRTVVAVTVGEIRKFLE